ncbi:MVL-like protein [Mya arenaria]|uniref:MVL-like protein n=1 Tax=Mya arenaria TaxID=6604 RepID=A0ABY7DB90_MYAAR|nr:MVL-like protein [Mya arenaria]
MEAESQPDGEESGQSRPQVMNDDGDQSVREDGGHNPVDPNGQFSGHSADVNTRTTQASTYFDQKIVIPHSEGRLSARLGVVTGMHLAEVCCRWYPRVPRILLWIMVEIAIIGGYWNSHRILPPFKWKYVTVAPNQVEVLAGMFIPYCKDCGPKQLLQAVGSRDVDRSKKSAVKEANFYFFIEAAIALFVSFLINVFVVSIFAEGFYGKTSSEIYDSCKASDNPHAEIFNGVFLGCQFGLAAMYVWAVGVLAAGQSSTMTGTYTGQFVMEGFLDLHWKRWQRVLLTRSIAIFPTILLAVFEGIQLPFALLPVLTFTSSPAIMADFVNGIVMKVIASVLTVVVIGINLFFVAVFIQRLPEHWAIYLAIAVVVCLYMAFVLVLAAFECQRCTVFTRVDQRCVGCLRVPEMYSVHQSENRADDTDVDILSETPMEQTSYGSID